MASNVFCMESAWTFNMLISAAESAGYAGPYAGGYHLHLPKPLPKPRLMPIPGPYPPLDPRPKPIPLPKGLGYPDAAGLQKPLAPPVMEPSPIGPVPSSLGIINTSFHACFSFSGYIALLIKIPVDPFSCDVGVVPAFQRFRPRF